MAPLIAVDPHAEPAGCLGSLADAAARLESALARLEALVDAGPLQSELFRTREGAAPSLGSEALRADLHAAQERARTLEAAAATASGALGRAMAQVREVLDGDGEEDRGEEPELDLIAATADDAPS